MDIPTIVEELEPYLNDLEARIDDADETELYERWVEFAQGGYEGQIFYPRRKQCRPPALEWPRVHVNDALDSLPAMALQQLGASSELLATGSGSLMAVRANYGTPILPTLFGAEYVRMPYGLNTLPCSRPLTRQQITARLDRGLPDLRAGYGGIVLDAGQWFKNLFEKYAGISKHVHIYHPDTQGPMDVCEMLYGSAIFELSYDEPAFLHDLLDLTTETLIAYLREWDRVVPLSRNGCSVHWGFLHRGSVMLRDDSAMNFSRKMFEKFVAPYDQRALEALGGGATHFCGRGHHFIAAAAALRGANAFNLGQPDHNDLETIFRATVDRGIQLLDFPGNLAQRMVDSGRNLHGNIHAARF